MKTKKEAYKINFAVLFKSILLTAAGTLILAFGTAVFIIPFDLVAGGVSGLSIVINRSTDGLLSVDLLITLLTWTLFFAGLFILGKGFAARTLLSSLIYPFGVAFFGRLAQSGFFNLGESAYPQAALLLSAIFGGLTVGAGCAVTFLGGGSTGGMDVVAFAVCKLFKHLRSSAVIFIIDSAIVILGIFAVGDLVLTLLGIITAFVAALAVDKIFLGGKRAFTAHIISDAYAEINAEVIECLGRTTTVSEVVGGYSGKPRRMLTVSFSHSQYTRLMRIISRADRNAFVTVHQAYQIGGEGWSDA